MDAKALSAGGISARSMIGLGHPRGRSAEAALATVAFWTGEE